MKRKIDLNQPPLRNSIPWRAMLGAVILFFLTSVTGFGQTSGLTLAELQDLQTQANTMELKLSQPAYANNPANAELIALYNDLMSKLAYHVRTLQGEDPAAFDTFTTWAQDAETQQEAAQQAALTDKWYIQNLLDQENAVNNPAAPVATSPLPDEGSYSVDPTK